MQMRLFTIRRYITAFILVALAGLSQLSFAETASDKTTFDEVKKETTDLIEALKHYSIEQRDVAVQATNDALVKLDQHLDALETRIDNNWDNLTQSARTESRANLKFLRKKRIELAESYGRLKSDSASSWKDIKESFSNTYSDLHDAWEKAKNEYGEDKSLSK